MTDAETRARQIHNARHRAGTADTCGSCRDLAAGITRPGPLRQLAYPAQPLRTGIGCAVTSVALIVAAIYLPLTSTATTVLVAVGFAAFLAQVWFLYGPPWRNAHPVPEPPIPSQTQTPTT